MPRLKRPFLATLLVGALFMMVQTPTIAQADSYVDTEPTEMAILGDVLIVRPFSIAMTGVGTVLFVATLPFSLPGGNSNNMLDTMVKKPAKTAFVRCLGCTDEQHNSRKSFAEK